MDRGLGMLSRHNPLEAVRCLQQALAACPPERSADLHRICFYLGIALRRAGHSQTAIRSWLSCAHLKKRGHSRRMLERMFNGYGMARQASEGGDDWQAFLAIQLSRYLATRNRRAFSTAAERDMVSDLIRDYWRCVKQSGALTGKDSYQKRDYFRGMRIVFPTVVLPEIVPGTLVAVDFRTKRRIFDSQTCFCGSGLPYAFCCGRTASCEELTRGSF
ncbi:MAG: SEC-C metal-binding domain-containing protein [Spirochaetes bacterium]|nr:SEC-C metal-binding domain-containing protein [Spirochaetota bacterium]